MKHKGFSLTLITLLVLLLGVAATVAVAQEPVPQEPESVRDALGTTFTYQGQLQRDGSPVDGPCDMAFRLYDAAELGAQVGSAISTTVPISDGLFTVGLDFGPDVFAGDGRWLDIRVKCDGDGDYASLGRQELTATPYALFARSAPWSGIVGLPGGFADGVDDVSAVISGTSIIAGDGLTQVASGDSVTMSVYFAGSGGDYGTAISVARSDHTHDGLYSYTAGTGLALVGTEFSVVTSTIQQRVADACGAGYAIREINADGTVTCEPVSGGTGGDYWSLTGNAGTDPSANFLGTTDGVSLTLAVNGTAALRLEPSGGTPNLIGGYDGNGVKGGVVGATIGGGGASDNVNYVAADYVAIGGGQHISVTGEAATVAGGSWISATGNYASVGGGYGNGATGNRSTVGGGWQNSAGSHAATVGGGEGNTAEGGAGPTVGGGWYNTANGGGATVAGGGNNSAVGLEATVGGGWENTADGDITTVGGGGYNTASAYAATVGGGYYNHAAAITATIGGGEHISVTGQAATVAGGFYITVTGDYATIGGGFYNTATSEAATVSGGVENDVHGPGATVGGGGFNTTANHYATIGGGKYNNATGGSATIGGGFYNHATAHYATVPGGHDAHASLYGQMAYASGRFYDIGDAQTGLYVLRNTTDTASETELFLDGSSERLVLNSNRTLTFDILVVARSSDDSSAGYQIQGIIENDDSVTQLIGSPTVVTLGEQRAAWDVTVEADTVNDALVIKVTGESGYTIRWVATVRTAEVMY